MPRWTMIGRMFDLVPDEAKAVVLDAVRSARGNMTEAARDLRVTRKHLYWLVKKYGFWDDVVRARRAARAGDIMERTRAELTRRSKR